MKKQIIITAFLLTLLLLSCGKKSVVISGRIENATRGEYIFLAELMENEVKDVDSVKFDEKGTFSFSREITIPVFYLLRLKNGNFFTLLAEPGEKIEFLAKYNSLNEPESVRGSEGTAKMIEYNKKLKATIEKIRGLFDIYNQNTDSPDLQKVMQTLDSMNKSYLSEINSYTKDYIDKNSGSLVTLLALYQQVAPRAYVLDPEKDIKYFVKVDSVLFRKYPESGPVKALHEQVGALVESIEAAKGSNAFLSTGSEAPEISLPSPDGKIISLSSTRGKIVLLDFWAAWCPPCRQENPNLVKAYNAYRDKGFEIFQVSLDRTREAWLKGIEEDNLGAWIHVSDLKYWNSSVVPQYRIESIPHNFLLDREGKIIASDLRGQELQIRLAEIFKQ